MVAIVKPKDAALAEFTKPRDGSCAGVPWHIASPAVHYDLHQVLGVGHFGTCYLATDKRTGETRAIKCLEKSHPEYDPAEVRNEVSVLSRVCNHPNIATLYEVYEDPKHVYLVQEACRGGELFDLIIEKKHFTEADAARAVAVMVSILQHCHECGVLHRDAKPENFLLRETVPEGARFDPANVRAVDFGLSALLEQGSPTEVVGSSYYIAPEVLSGTSYGPPADAWSLGVIAFILISGYPPFWGGSDAAIFDKIQHQDLDME